MCGNAQVVREGDFIQTSRGERFWPLDARPYEIYIEDIAHALAAINRYTGHTKVPYNVAQHSVLVARLVEHLGPMIALKALLHDATEAYLNDISRPLKVLDEYLHFREAEARLEAVIAVTFGLSDDAAADRIIKDADRALLWWEAKALMRRPDGTLPDWWHKWERYAALFPHAGTDLRNLEAWDSEDAEAVFLKMYDRLRREAGFVEPHEQAVAAPPAETVTTPEPDALPDFVASSGAVRSADVSDLDFASMPLVGLLGVLKVAGCGGIKYGRFNYAKGFPVHETLNHMAVHMIRWACGDRSEPHMEKVAWGAMVIAQTQALQPELVAPHVPGPGFTLTPELLAEMDRGKPERDAARKRGEFEALFHWEAKDIPAVAEIVASRGGAS